MTTQAPADGATSTPAPAADVSPAPSVGLTSTRAMVRSLAHIGEHQKAADVWLLHLWDAYHLAELNFLAAIEANRPTAMGAATAAQARYAEFNANQANDPERAVRMEMAGWSA